MATVSYNWNPDFDFFNKVINTTTAGNQGVPDVAGLANGSFVATWDDPGNSGDVRGNILAGNGTPILGSDVNFSFPGTAGAQFDTSVAGFAGGGLIVVYVDASSDPGGDIRFGQGGPVSPGLAVAVGDEDDSQPDVAALADGGIVVTWTRGASDVMRKVFNHTGSVRAEEAAVDGGTNGSQPQGSSVAALTGGGFVVVFHELHLDLGGTFTQRVLLRRYDANGNALDAIAVLTDTTGSINRDIQVVGLQDGGFAVAYTDNEYGAGTDIHVRIYNADGSQRIDLGRINDFTAGDQDKPTLALLSNGFFVVGWRNQDRLKLQAFDPQGNEIAGEYQDAFSAMIDAEIAGLADGRLVNVRSTASGDGDGTAIRAQASDLVRTTTGDATSEVLAGDGLIDLMSGGDGNDAMSGAGANDILAGDGGDDTLTGGTGGDGLDGGGDTDTADYAGSAAAVTVDLATGLGSDGDAAGDTLTAIENVTGSAGNDSITGNGGANKLLGLGGNDTLKGGAGDDTLNGQSGDDKLIGGGGLDRLFGGSGADTLIGRGGNDTLTGGTGRDVMTGDAGSDTFDFNAVNESAVGGERDRINDFTKGEDVIDVAGIDANAGAGGNQAFTFIGGDPFSGSAGELRVTTTGAGNSIISGDTDGDGSADFQILVQGVTGLTAGDFLL